MAKLVTHEAGGLFNRLLLVEQNWSAPPFLQPALEQVYRFLAEEAPLPDLPPSVPLIRATLVLLPGSQQTISCRHIRLAGGTEMIFWALIAQRNRFFDGEGDFYHLLMNDLVLAQALNIFTTDGDPRIMNAVAEGSSALCEALIAEVPASSQTPLCRRHLARFYQSCLQVGGEAWGLAPKALKPAEDLFITSLCEGTFPSEDPLQGLPEENREAFLSILRLFLFL